MTPDANNARPISAGFVRGHPGRRHRFAATDADPAYRSTSSATSSSSCGRDSSTGGSGGSVSISPSSCRAAYRSSDSRGVRSQATDRLGGWPQGLWAAMNRRAPDDEPALLLVCDRCGVGGGSGRGDRAPRRAPAPLRRPGSPPEPPPAPVLPAADPLSAFDRPASAGVSVSACQAREAGSGPTGRAPEGLCRMLRR